MTITQIKTKIIEWITTGIPANIKSYNLRSILTNMAIRMDLLEPGRLRITKAQGNTALELEIGDMVYGYIEGQLVREGIYLGGDQSLLSSYEILGASDYLSSIGDVTYYNTPGSLEYTVVGNWYKILGALYGPINNTVEFADGDATYDRFDIIVLNQDNTATIIPGIAEEDPQIPTYDLQTQVLLLTKRISANQTEDTDVTNITVYADNLGTGGGEFDAVGETNVIVDSTEQNNGGGTKSIKFNGVPVNTKVTLTDSSSHNGSDVTGVKFDVYLPADQNQKIGIRFRPATTGLFANVNLPSGYYGYDSSVVGVWQTVILPASIFNNLTDLVYDKIDIYSGQNGNKTFFIDNVEIQTGIQPVIGDYLPTGGYSGTAQDLENLILTYSKQPKSIGGYIVDTTGNTNENAIEVGNVIQGTRSAGRYIIARVDSLPYTDDANLSFYLDSQLL